jgi:hypothetical protein
MRKFSSHLVKIIEYLICLFVCDDTFVGALHFVEEDDVHVGLRALAEAGRHHESVEQVRVRLNVFKFVLRCSVHETTPETSVG